MSPAVKYTLGRIGLFVLVLLALWPVELYILVKVLLALAFSAALSFFLLRGWRDEMAQQMAESADRRRAEKDRLRSALAGEEQPDQGTAQADESTPAANPPTEPDDGPAAPDSGPATR